MKTKVRTHVPDAAGAVLAALWKAFACARDLRIDPWEFSLPLLHLVDLGVDKSDLRWLVLHGYATFRDRARRFFRGTNVAAGSDPRFLITAEGALVAGAKGDGADGPSGRSSNSVETVAFRAGVPYWDSDRRVLCFGGEVVKQFRFHAPNQAAVLAAFQEENWPHRVDDPLPPIPDLPPKQRLHETIKSLNANQACGLLRFRGDGTGEGICWEPHCACVFAANQYRRAARTNSSVAGATAIR